MSARFYCQDIRAYDILFGELPRPAQAEDLYEILDTFTEKYESAGQRANARRDARQQHKASVGPTSISLHGHGGALPGTPASGQPTELPLPLKQSSRGNATHPGHLVYTNVEIQNLVILVSSTNDSSSSEQPRYQASELLQAPLALAAKNAWRCRV